ncbi:MAG: AMP-binding protein [Candidatus Dormibacteria bacterium]
MTGVAEKRSFGARLSDLASDRPLDIALVHLSPSGDQRQVTYGELASLANRWARVLPGFGVTPQTLVMLSVPPTVETVAAAYAVWKVGASILPCNPKMPAAEREALLEVARQFRPTITVGDWEDSGHTDIRLSQLVDGVALTEPPIDAVPAPGVVMASGGTTGRPKLIVDSAPATLPIVDGMADPGAFVRSLGYRQGQIFLVCTPLYHSNGWSWLHLGLMTGNLTVLIERFEAAAVIDAIERHRVTSLLLVPAVMQRLSEAPGLQARQLRSIENLIHGGAPCPGWLKRLWIDLVGPEHLYEGYGATEYHGKTAIRGDEWLRHTGSVGLPVASDLAILDDDLNPLPAGEVGEVFMRPEGSVAPAFSYVGAAYHRVTPDGFASLGDFGRVDDDGYLYIVDRRVDMIISGGANVYPAEVEAALGEHEAVADVAVVGIPDERWGKRVHAIIQPRDQGSPPTEEDLDRHCRDRLAPHKVPKTYEFLAQMPRTEVGKLAHRVLAGERGA